MKVSVRQSNQSSIIIQVIANKLISAPVPGRSCFISCSIIQPVESDIRYSYSCL